VRLPQFIRVFNEVLPASTHVRASRITSQLQYFPTNHVTEMTLSKNHVPNILFFLKLRTVKENIQTVNLIYTVNGNNL